MGLPYKEKIDIKKRFFFVNDAMQYAIENEADFNEWVIEQRAREFHHLRSLQKEAKYDRAYLMELSYEDLRILCLENGMNYIDRTMILDFLLRLNKEEN